MSEHHGVLAFLSEAADIKAELGVSADEAFAIQRERAAARTRPTLILCEHPSVIAEKIAAQLGMTPAEAVDHMRQWDELSIQTFCEGNEFPTKDLN